MNNYADFPPIHSFKRVLRSSPQSALLYASLWKNKPKGDRISIKKRETKKNFLISQTLFRNHLLALSRLDIASFEETTEFYLVDFHEHNE